MLSWIKPSIVNSTYDKLFLCYKNGYPLQVCEWRTGYGFISITDRMTFNPELVAYINLPEILPEEKQTNQDRTESNTKPYCFGSYNDSKNCIHKCDIWQECMKINLKK